MPKPVPDGKRTRCGALTRRKDWCRSWPIKGKKRCRMHGGCSTGPRTPQGKAASQTGVARWRAETRAQIAAGLLARFPQGRKPGWAAKQRYALAVSRDLAALKAAAAEDARRCPAPLPPRRRRGRPTIVESILHDLSLAERLPPGRLSTRSLEPLARMVGDVKWVRENLPHGGADPAFESALDDIARLEQPLDRLLRPNYQGSAVLKELLRQVREAKARNPGLRPQLPLSLSIDGRGGPGTSAGVTSTRNWSSLSRMLSSGAQA
jgi:hypothetical protein